jgi:D-3-phosphoglycerate dehydrogenase
MTRKILITASPIYKQAIDRLSDCLRQAGCEVRYWNRPDERLAEAELLELLRDVEIYIVGNARVPRSVIERSPQLALISKYGVGVDNVDLDAATEHGVLVTNAPGANAISVAEMTMGLLLSLSRALKEIERSLRDGGWRIVAGHELSGRTLGIMGLGNIGKQVAMRARAFNMRVLANDIVEYPEFCAKFEVEPVSFDRLLSESDVVTLHVPLTPLTRHRIGRRELALMRRGSILIHTARGGVVDEKALYEALASRHLAGAAVDVFEQEPLGDSPLRSLQNVILTPHIAGITYEASERIAGRTLRNVQAYLAGSAPPDLVNPGALRAARPPATAS